MSAYILDSCAVIAALRNEAGVEQVRFVIRSGQPVLIGAINVLEICYDEMRFHADPASGKDVLRVLETWPVTIVRDLSDEFLMAAARFKARGRLSLADACALALAEVNHGIVVTADHHEFDTLEAAGFTGYADPARADRIGQTVITATFMEEILTGSDRCAAPPDRCFCGCRISRRSMSNAAVRWGDPS